MKKFLSGILFLLISVFIFADSSASVEGVIEVAGKDELPAGYFGKAAGYLPGDSVSITNPNTGITLQILNLGTLDASGGIAILISEESAKSLGIERNSGVKVKLAPRSGYFDETVSGNAVLDEKTLPAAKEEPVSDVSAEPAVQAGPEAASQPAENAAVSVEPAAPVAVAGVPLIADTEDNAEEEDAEVAAVEDEAETPVDEIDSEDETDFSDEEKLSAEPVEEEVSADDEPSVEEETEPVIVEAPAPTEECEVPEEPYEDYESVEDGLLESKEAVEQPSPAEESEVEAVTVEEPDPIEEETEDLPEEENAELVIVEEPQEEEPETPTEDETEEEAVTVEEPSPIEEDSAAEENQMEEVSEPEEVVAEPNAEPEAQSSGESESSDYAPIVLVPSEPESPESPVDASIENEPIEIVPVESVTEEKKSEPEPLQTEYPVSIQDYVVSSESALASNCYYIQIATMGNIKNIENILVKYSKYPVSLIPAGKNYRVLVGPLSVDEYGAVLAKFKNAGFKDAFVRKR
ncbi:SPOR domain-containing protein [Treponema succinifaciens]|uniref:Sporulation domain-containing protein n=1 Tax=Treponema succinifaciens (strain ATCC 33096 / DSM 2489 / 6091) TaxID=869209 RepID=F2NST0_TRES6|nr:SPOR domain-containing protein [Treponema succinifaciens]AEB14318.1 Sporulation domain-containing protein [Treponema succinifaciens DSM 2489]